MIINWFPGHMATARRKLVEAMPKVDVVIEVLDARLPRASANPLLDELRRDKPCLKLLNKTDLADPAATKDWIKYFNAQKNTRALAVSAKKASELMRIKKICRELAPKRGTPGRPVRVVVVGIPNVGKSTLINSLAGRKIARVGDKPAITTCQQQVDLRDGIMLYDTPGMLWPDLSDQQAAYRLAAAGSIGDNAMDPYIVSLFALDFLLQRYPRQLQSRYNLERLEGGPEELLLDIGRRRGCLIAGGEVDPQRASELVLRELRAGSIGAISLELPQDPVIRKKETQVQVP